MIRGPRAPHQLPTFSDVFDSRSLSASISPERKPDLSGTQADKFRKEAMQHSIDPSFGFCRFLDLCVFSYDAVFDHSSFSGPAGMRGAFL